MFTTVVLYITALYLLFLGYIMKAANIRSKFIFNILPVMLGVCLFVIAMFFSGLVTINW